LNNSTAGWIIIFLMTVSANFPFLTESLFGVWRLKRGDKSFFIRLIELSVLYFVVLGIARLLESNAGNAFSQDWQFYAVTVCLFLVLAFPGFTFRYLRRRSA
jgi:uncharacterized membrane protein